MPSYVLDLGYRIQEPDGIAAHRAVVRGNEAGTCRLPEAANAFDVLGITTHAQLRDGKGIGVRRAGIATAEAAGPIDAGDPVTVADSIGRLRRADGASATIGSTLSNNAVRYTLRHPHTSHADLEIGQAAASGNNQPLSASIAAGVISIELGTDGSGDAASTAAEVIAFVNGHAELSQVLRADAPEGSDSTGIAEEDSGGFAVNLDSSNVIGYAEESASDEGDLIDVFLARA